MTAAPVQQAEQALLGCMLLEGGALVRALELVEAGDFEYTGHRTLFTRMVALHDAGDPVEPSTLGIALREYGELDAAGGMTYLMALLEAVATAASVETHARAVVGHATLRKLLALGEKVMQRAGTTPAAEVQDLLNWVTGELDQVSRNYDTSEFALLREHTNALVDDIERQQGEGKYIRGLRTGYDQLDRVLGGLRGQRLVIGARTSDGKTSLMLNLLSGVARREVCPVALFSLEQPASELAAKLLARDSGIEPRRLNSAQLGGDDWLVIREAQVRAHDTALWICDRAGMTVEEMRRKVRGLVQRTGVKVVGVDFLQIAATARRCDSEALRVGSMMQRLADMARECRVTLIIASQLNREADRLPPGEPPDNHHLKESGSIEQYADATLFLAHERGDGGQRTGNAVLAVRKNRMGPSGFCIDLHWDDKRQLFTEVEEQEERGERLRDL